jgi:Cys-rich four helix bundle protein (predicted Tat secretion target)
VLTAAAFPAGRRRFAFFEEEEMTQNRREVLTGLAGVGAALLATEALAQKKDEKKADVAPPKKAEKDAAPPTAVSPALQAVIDATNACLAAGNICLARCTDHLAAGMPTMADCQRAVMNMLAVSEAVSKVTAYRNSTTKNQKALAAACAEFCRTCAVECEKHADMHAECKACGEACRTCAKACDAFVASK